MLESFASIPVLVWVVCVLFFSTLIRSAFGFGDALIAMPILALFLDMRIATPVVAFGSSLIAGCLLIGHWRSVQIRSAWRLIVSTIVGIPLGLWLLKGTYESVLKLILGAVILLFGAYRLIRPNLFHLKSERNAFGFGFIAGILGGAYNTNGPPVIIYGLLRKWPPETFRATLQGYFFPTGLLVLAGHGSAGLWTRDVVSIWLAALPMMLLAIWLGERLHRTIPHGKFDSAVYILLVLVGAVLLVQTLV